MSGAGQGPAGGEPVIWLDGALRPAVDARVSVLDRGLLYGDGVFTVARAQGGRVVELERHLEQLCADAACLRLVAPPLPELVGAVAAVVAALPPTRARIRVALTGGPGSLALRWSERQRGSALVMGEPASAPPAALRVAIVDEPRLVPSRTWAPKTLAYLPSLQAREQARERGADEAIRLFPDDTAGEAAAGNLFAVLAGVVVTPPALGIRPGVTRRRVLELCHQLGLPWQERSLGRAELGSADELFVTSSVAGLVPIIALDGAPRAVGVLARSLLAAYEAFSAAG